MWQRRRPRRDAQPRARQSFGGGGGIGSLFPAIPSAYGVLNYTEFAISERDYISVRNEWWDDPRGMRRATPEFTQAMPSG